LAVRGDDFFAEFSLDFRERGLAGLDKLPRKFVGVHDLRAAGAEEFGSGGFSHANAAGQSEELHQPHDKAGFFLRDENLSSRRAGYTTSSCCENRLNPCRDAGHWNGERAIAMVLAIIALPPAGDMKARRGLRRATTGS